MEVSEEKISYYISQLNEVKSKYENELANAKQKLDSTKNNIDIKPIFQHGHFRLALAMFTEKYYHSSDICYRDSLYYVHAMQLCPLLFEGEEHLYGDLGIYVKAVFTLLHRKKGILLVPGSNDQCFTFFDLCIIFNACKVNNIYNNNFTLYDYRIDKLKNILNFREQVKAEVYLIDVEKNNGKYPTCGNIQDLRYKFNILNNFESIAEKLNLDKDIIKALQYIMLHDTAIVSKMSNISFPK
jgi:hypothetical protein